MPKNSRELTRSLDRARGALEKGRRGLEAKKARNPVPATFGTVALVLFIVALATGQHWLLYLAAIAAVAGGGLMLATGGASQLLGGFAGSGDAAHAQIGMGATVAADAVLEPGARVEMGATVGAGATVRSGAVIRMGSTVGARAVIERGATVSWGATVHDSAVVEEDAIVGAGSAVLSGGRVPAGTWLRPGTTFGGRGHTAPRSQPAPPADPRLQRVGSACDKLEGELRASPERVREFLGGSEETIGGLRRTCQDLARRERELAAEVDAAALARLDEERAGLEKRIATQRDELTANSLRGALAAIDEQKRQREILKVRAERLDAEQTRLMYTLEGLASQFVRMRTSGAQPQTTTAEVERSVAQLRSELDAIADALDEVALDAPPDRLPEFADAPATRDDEPRSGRLQTRE